MNALRILYCFEESQGIIVLSESETFIILTNHINIFYLHYLFHFGHLVNNIISGRPVNLISLYHISDNHRVWRSVLTILTPFHLDFGTNEFSCPNKWNMKHYVANRSKYYDPSKILKTLDKFWNFSLLNVASSEITITHHHNPRSNLT